MARGHTSEVEKLKASEIKRRKRGLDKRYGRIYPVCEQAEARADRQILRYGMPAGVRPEKTGFGRT